MSSDDPQSRGAFRLPIGFRLVLGAMALLIGTPPLIQGWRQALGAANTDVNGELLIAATFLAVAALAPWKALNLRIRKAGWLEFDEVVETQAQETNEAIGELETRVAELEQGIRATSEVAPLLEHLASVQLSPLVLAFLEHKRPEAYSPVRLRSEGSAAPGYEPLSQFTSAQVGSVLRQLVATGQLRTVVSRRGNTLFRAK